MTLKEEAEKRINELNDEIFSRQSLLKNYIAILYGELRKECDKYVSKCYKTNTKYIKVLDTPRPYFSETKVGKKVLIKDRLPSFVIEIEGGTIDTIKTTEVRRAEIDPEVSDPYYDFFSERRAVRIPDQEFQEFLTKKIEKIVSAETMRSINP